MLQQMWNNFNNLVWWQKLGRKATVYWTSYGIVLKRLVESALYFYPIFFSAKANCGSNEARYDQ